MIIGGTEKRLANASIFLKNAYIELMTIPCECSEDEGCWRCDLLHEVKNVRKDINDEIAERFS